MMNLKLTTDPDTAGHRGAKYLAGTADVPPKPTIHLAPAGSPLFMRLPENSCDVRGCKKYGHAFPSAQALLEHARAVHMRRNGHPQTPQPETPPTQAATAKKYKCKHCELTFESWRKLGPHVRYSHPKSKPVKRDTITVKIGDKYYYPCPDCEAKLSTRASLRSHRFHTHGITEASPAMQHTTAPATTVTATPPAPPQTSTLDPQPSFTLTLTGTKAECGAAAMLLLENGYNNLTTGKL